MNDDDNDDNDPLMNDATALNANDEEHDFSRNNYDNNNSNKDDVDQKEENVDEHQEEQVGVDPTTPRRRRRKQLLHQQQRTRQLQQPHQQQQHPENGDDDDDHGVDAGRRNDDDNNNNDDDDDSSSSTSSLVPATPADTRRGRGGGGGQQQGRGGDGGGSVVVPGTPLTPLTPLDQDQEEEEEKIDDDDNDNEEQKDNNDGDDVMMMMMDDENGSAEEQKDDNDNDDEIQHQQNNNNNDQSIFGQPQVAHIRGTDVHVPTAADAFKDFVLNFRSLQRLGASSSSSSSMAQRRISRRRQRRPRQQPRGGGGGGRRQSSRGAGDDDDDDDPNSSSSSYSGDDDNDEDSDDDDDDDGIDDDDYDTPPPYLAMLKSFIAPMPVGNNNNNNGNATTTSTTTTPTTRSLDINTMHLYYHSAECQRLYYQLIAYPIEMIPLMDLVAQRELQRLFALEREENEDNDDVEYEEPVIPTIQVRPYNLRHISNLRCLDPVSMDSLISIRGMVVRSSSIIPDLKIAHFSCYICGHDIQVTIDRGRIAEPNTRCPTCNTSSSYQLIHNRCIFADKQLVRVQETPDKVPAGQTPASVVTFVFDDIVDTIQPGDRIEITGVLRAQPVRVHPKISKLKSVYKTYVDVVHVKKITGMETNDNKDQMMMNQNNINNNNNNIENQNPTLAAAATAAGSNNNNNNNNNNIGGPNTRNSNHHHRTIWKKERIDELEALSRLPDIYDKLTQSLAPSIWELDDVKKGILCMLFGGNHVRVQRGTAAAAEENRKNQQQRRQRRRNTANEEDDQNENEDDDDDEENLPDYDDNGNGNTTTAGGGGHETNNNKNTNTNTTTSKLNKRGDLNVLLVGDPGTSKSQLLSYVNKLSTRGVYTSGKGSSAVGLTASVVRDPETKELVLESGALVLSDLGITCIDEFDKMSDTTRSVLHEAMEQQTVSIAKAGIIATLQARTSVLASANPIESRYNPSMSVVDNIQLPATLLSRFDLIYLILDRPQVDRDRRLAQHLVGLYYETPNIIEPPMDHALLRDYIQYARENIHPELSDEASEYLLTSYLEMRNPSVGGGGGSSYASSSSSTGTRTISATPRQLESLVRLSEAIAKMRYSRVVTRNDTAEAVRLMKVATQAAATDPRTGRIDMDMITTGRSTAARELEEQIEQNLRELLTEQQQQQYGTTTRMMKVRDVTRQLLEVTGMSIQQHDVVVALRRMEADGYIHFNERTQTISVRTGIVR